MAGALLPKQIGPNKKADIHGQLDIKVAPCWVDGKPGLTSMENLSAETSLKPQDIKKGFNKTYPGQVQYLRRYLECIRKLYTL